MSLFDDPAVIAAVADAAGPICYEDSYESPYEIIRDALPAALAALPLAELIEEHARAVAARNTGAPWLGLPEADRTAYREDAKAGLMAIGLIPEHVTATEERPTGGGSLSTSHRGPGE